MMQRIIFVGISLLLVPMLTMGGPVKMEKIEYGGWPNCIKLSNGEVELVVTTDVGPRIIRYGFVNGQNLFKEYADQLGKTGGDEWMLYGGSRLWHAPEAAPRTYALDNSPVPYEWTGQTLILRQPVEETTGIEKHIEITLDPDSSRVHLNHRLINRNLWDIEVAPWVLTIMAQGGRAIFPQEEYRPHPDYLLPARPIVLWHYTNMSDRRWVWGEKYIQLIQDPNDKTKEKIGILNRQGWAAYALKGELFVKLFAFDENATYPDYNSNCETFTNEDMLEVETLGPMTKLAADGGTVEHVENWFLYKAEAGKDDASIEKIVLPLVNKSKDQVK